MPSIVRPVLFLAGLACATAALAEQGDHVEVSAPWIRALPGTLPAGGYMTLANAGDEPVTLTGVDSPAFGHAMLHRSSVAGGQGRMEHVGELEIPAHDAVALAPGGYHLMLMHATSPLRIGSTVPLTLHFADGSTRAVEATVRPANAQGIDD
ncbi:copper chaperone PCu(A)C [Coralloluteibacterium stylophorae]|uniref:Copper chaperone PCu(A)C n=1 Tax=Coralloluteibacterium stylophorae TaxID=1776034 RepID=A0A8J7VUN3_9GAMM|nr:copper chaperone PCu(A)C [Coralloluteibacterium stylophorae]MBS7457012.1 copper chaperone PCu(A)C [Coralloluteibacterium stylophorae]